MDNLNLEKNIKKLKRRVKQLEQIVDINLFPGVFFGGNSTDILGLYYLDMSYDPEAYRDVARYEIRLNGHGLCRGDWNSSEDQIMRELCIDAPIAENLFAAGCLEPCGYLTIEIFLYGEGDVLEGYFDHKVRVIKKENWNG